MNITHKIVPATIQRLALLAIAALVGVPAHAATTDKDLADTFSYCAAIAIKGKQSSTNPKGQQFFGDLYTKYLTSALSFAQISEVKSELQSSIERHGRFLGDSSKSEDERATQILGSLDECARARSTNIARIDASVGRSSVEVKLSPEPGKTTTLDILGALGKPFHEDYNQDGRFVYNYQTATGFDVYLFDSQAILIRARSYCDSLKSKCPQ